MLVLDNNQIVSNFIKEVRSQVGELLSDLPRQSGQDPLKAVIKDIQSGTRPDYPYIVLTLERNAKKDNTWLRNQYIDEQDTPHYVRERVVNIRVTCYGPNCTSILDTLSVYTLDDYTRTIMSNNVGAVFQDYSEIIREPVYLSTDFVETAFMIATFVVVSDWANTTTTGGIIERVEGDGYYLDYEDQPLEEGIQSEFATSISNNNP